MGRSALFDHLDDLEPRAAAALAAADVRRLRAGSSHRAAAFHDASFLIVEDGFVVTRSVLAGRRPLVTCHAGVAGLLAAPEDGEMVQALVEARVTLVTEAAYADLLADSTVATVLSDALRALLRQRRDSIANFANARPVERVESKLVQLARDHGFVVPDGVRLDVPLTHELLADMIGCARETVSRAIDRLESAGVIVRDGRCYRLQVNPETI
jgi:hypothetical protein